MSSWRWLWIASLVAASAPAWADIAHPPIVPEGRFDIGIGNSMLDRRESVVAYAGYGQQQGKNNVYDLDRVWEGRIGADLHREQFGVAVGLFASDGTGAGDTSAPLNRDDFKYRTLNLEGAYHFAAGTLQIGGDALRTQRHLQTSSLGTTQAGTTSFTETLYWIQYTQRLGDSHFLGLYVRPKRSFNYSYDGTLSKTVNEEEPAVYRVGWGGVQGEGGDKRVYGLDFWISNAAGRKGTGYVVSGGQSFGPFAVAARFDDETGTVSSGTFARKDLLIEGYWRPGDWGTMGLYYDWNFDNYDLSLAQPNQTNRNTRFGFKVTGEF
ncbi:MAG: hypothetical protein COX57_00925 [Alphaproteobacteria bacterium CG_4_10_14_0_2_um_filter_63_37]|nr:MAG: hypothetical protein AUJ55_11290 [Proteobacteria bacterium CG1_02_64_396]PJA25884.1 MAG: hypothetical protein COX57_00925 [Alphaproteobacteria bacterium CG_4_10_14_0_2_um_filter_63_37]